MSDKDEQALTPKLRFPEFSNGPGWERLSFGNLYAFRPTNTLSRDKLNYERGAVRNIHYGDIHTRFRALFNIKRELVPFVNDAVLEDFEDRAYCAEGDMVFADASEDLDDVGKSIEIVALHGDRVVSGTHTLLATRRDARLVLGFGGYLFQSDRMRKQIRREAQGSKVYGISSGRLSSIEVCFPTDKGEQKKIADSLTSLDDLIAAEGRKLEALRDHKKGLLQQLFPQPGETRPRLRFPEFRDAGEWDTMSLGQLLARTPDYGVNASAVPYSKDLPTYIRITDINDDGRFITEGRTSVAIEAKENNFLHDGDIVLARTGASVGKSYRYRLEDGRLVFAGFLIRVRPNPKRLLTDFLIGFLATRTYWDWVSVTSTRSGQPGINGAEYASLPIPVPPIQSGSQGLIEQQKIAECLTSLDDLASAQADRIAILQAFKRGLMQNLFPSAEYLER